MYLANALVPESDRVAITGRDRDGAQQRLAITYLLQDEQSASVLFQWLMAGAAGLLMFAAGSRARRVVIP